MKIKVVPHTVRVIGKRDDGQWCERVDGKWIPCSPPERWETRTVQARRKPVRPITPSHPMVDPLAKEREQAPLVRVRRVIERDVPDYEAEVLCRNGWERV